MLLYHGSDLESLGNLLNGRRPDAAVAAKLHLNGAPGLSMAVLMADAEYFAVRRGGNIVTIELEDDTLAELIRLAPRRQPVPMTPCPLASMAFDGDGLFVPVDLLRTFNVMRERF